jgi:pimeloyl-ACP methyl ester carboxylesterase
MTTATVDGLKLRYELLGAGPPLVLTPGGRFDLDIPGLRPLAERLAERYTVLLWDRPNSGRSDVRFAGPSETEMCADVLAALLRELDLAPAVIAGGSAGARMSLQFGLRHPDLATAVVAWWVSGGPYGTFSLGSAYVVPSLEAAHRGGMAAVAALPHWAERIEANPRNGDLLREQDPAEFIAVMERWLQAYLPGVGGPVAGMRDEDIAGLSRPLVIVRGDPLDYNHPESVTVHIHDLVPGSRLVPSPWEAGEWARVMTAYAAGTGELFAHWPDLAPVLLAELAASTGRSGHLSGG